MTKEKAVQISHGDLDGVISAVIAHEIYSQFKYDVTPLWSQPYWLANPRYVGDLSMYDKIMITDIAINNRDVNSVMEFIFKYHSKVIWYDHHLGWKKLWSEYPNLSRLKDALFFTDEKCPSCVDLITRIHREQKFSSKINGLIKLAHLTDQGKNLDNPFHKALKVNPKSNELRYEIFWYALAEDGGAVEEDLLHRIYGTARYYDKTIKPNTMKVLKEGKIKGNIMFLDISRYKNAPLDKTDLFFEAYKKKNVDHVVLRFTTKDRQPVTTIATNTSQNLIKTFGQKSGQPYRLTLFKLKLSNKQIADKLS